MSDYIFSSQGAEEFWVHDMPNNFYWGLVLPANTITGREFQVLAKLERVRRMVSG